MKLLIITLTIAVINGEPYGGGTSGYFGGFNTNTHLNVNVNGGGGGGDTLSPKCPRLCTCTGHTVDCSHRGLTQVPRKIPLETERL